MNNRALLSAIAICFAVAACSRTEEAPKPKPKAEAPKPPEAPTATPASGTALLGSATNRCNLPTCDVAIDVTQCSDKGNDIKATPDPYYTAPPNKVIHWKIGGSGYGFVGKGIDFKTDGGKSNFKNPKPGSTDWYYDNSGTTGTYPYAIWLKGPNGNCHVDPTIVN